MSPCPPCPYVSAFERTGRSLAVCRRKWDATLRQFVAGFSRGALILCGDLNVAYEDSDLTHPSYFKVM